ncbi:MAG TPA: RDD family protein [Myxococcales bacterium]|nr:RDD family protein [Myxococcales bacterium]
MSQARRRPKLRVVEEGTEGSPFPRCSLWLRGAARAVDVAIAYGLYRAGGRAGLVMAFLYLLLADGLWSGQSVGKRLCGVKAIYLPHRIAARFRESVLRNAPLGLVVLLRMMPDETLPAAAMSSGPSTGTIAFFAGAVLIGGIEAWHVLRHPLGMRLGDVWADTQVVDGKDVAGGQVLDRAAQPPARAPDRVTLQSAGRTGSRGGR